MDAPNAVEDLRRQIAAYEADSSYLEALALRAFETVERYKQDLEVLNRIAPAVSAMPAAQIRKRALFRVFCSDCDDMLIAAVLQVQGADVLVTRGHRGGFQAVGVLDVEGPAAFCKRRRLVLTTGMVRYALERGRRDVHADHRARPGEPHYLPPSAKRVP